jgi:hypothetical protein
MQLRARIDRALDLFGEAGAGVGRGERPELRGLFHRIADLHHRHGLGEAV